MQFGLVVGHVLGTPQVENRSQAAVQVFKRGLISLEEVGGGG